MIVGFFSENYLGWSRIENVESGIKQNDVNLTISGKQNLIQAFVIRFKEFF